MGQLSSQRSEKRGNGALVFLVLCLCWGVGSAADENGYAACAAHAREEADRILQDAARIEELHRGDLDDMLDRFYRRHSADDSFRNVIDTVVQRMIQRSEIVRARQQLVDELIASVLDIGEPNDESFRCRELRYSGPRSGNLRRYADELEAVRSRIAERLDLENLGDDEGLVVIAFYAFGSASSISINRLGALTGGIEFGPVNNGEYFRVIRAKAGEYRWERIRQEFWNTRYFYDLGPRNLTFVVEPGKLNYTGVFIFRPRGSTARNSLNDRASIVMLILQQRYPNLLERFEIANGLVPDDRFIDYYLAEQRRLGAEVESD